MLAAGALTCVKDTQKSGDHLGVKVFPGLSDEKRPGLR